jgi:hypothetical protein
MEGLNEFLQKEKVSKRSYRTYTEEEDKIILAKEMPDKEIANLLNMPESRIWNRRAKLNQGSKKPEQTNNISESGYTILSAATITITQGEIKLGNYTIKGSFTIFVDSK